MALTYRRMITNKGHYLNRLYSLGLDRTVTARTLESDIERLNRDYFALTGRHHPIAVQLFLA